MSKFLTQGSPVLTLVAALAILAAGCRHTASCSHPKGAVGGAKETSTGKAVTKADDKKAYSGQDETWCDEHGLPESVCDLCSRKYREAEKAKGNWCAHSRVKTSCFNCNPGLKERYAAKYKAKYGKAPPATEEEEKRFSTILEDVRLLWGGSADPQRVSSGD